MQKKSALLILACFLISCGSGIDTQILRDEVLDIHDEVMPKMGQVMSLRKKVRAKSQEILLTENFDQIKVSDLDSIAEALELANKEMMSWMNDWTKNSSSYLDVEAKPKEGVKFEEVVKFLEEEKKRVLKIKTDLNEAISAAKAILGN